MRHIDRRPAYPRAALFFIALLSTVLFGGVQDLGCETHGLGMMHSRNTDVGAASARTGDAMPGMSHATDDQSSGDGETGCGCSCTGVCTLAAPLAIPPAASTLRVAIVEAQPVRVMDLVVEHALPRAPDRLLPFANGPPALS